MDGWPTIISVYERQILIENLVARERPGKKLRYVHRNPVKRKLCARPEEWEWSSFRQYATGCEGRVEIECEWVARKRERKTGRLVLLWNCPIKPMTAGGSILARVRVGHLILRNS